MGVIDREKISLKGKVNIKGSLAHYAGFNSTEDILIEIPSSSLVRTFKQIQNQRNLASL